MEWTDSAVVMLDQRLLPAREIHNSYQDYRGVAEAIRSMVVRGAPAIGVAAAMGIALGVKECPAGSVEELESQFRRICDEIAATRPTAVNLFWAVDRMRRVFAQSRPGGVGAVRAALIKEGISITTESTLPGLSS